MRAACAAQDNQPYYRKTACLPSGITDEMTKDSTRITAAQKRAAEAVFAFTHELNEETRRIMRETQDPALAARAELSQRLRDPQINTLQEDRCQGKLRGENTTLPAAHGRSCPQRFGKRIAPALRRALLYNARHSARVAKLVDAPGLGPDASRRAGSSSGLAHPT